MQAERAKFIRPFGLKSLVSHCATIGELEVLELGIGERESARVIFSSPLSLGRAERGNFLAKKNFFRKILLFP